MSKCKSKRVQRLRRGALATGTIGALVAVAAGATPALAAAGTLALSAATGPSGGLNTLIATFATAPTAPNATTFNASTAANFVAPVGTAAATCPATYAAPGTNLGITGSALRVLAPTKIAVTVPIGVTHSGTAASTRYMLCVYNGSTPTTSTLVASSPYVVGLRPTLHASTSISPTTGPALGGTTVTVTGTNFVQNTTAAPNNTTATLGGEPLTNINVATGGLSFTATTPAHVADENVLLSVTTPGGTVSTLPNGTKAEIFDFTNGVVVTPNTASNTKTTPTDIDVTGVGFATMNFTNTTGLDPDAAGAHVYLTDSQYVGTGTTTPTTGPKVNFPIAECTNVIVVTDTELLCSLLLTQSRGNDGEMTFAKTVTIQTNHTTNTSTIISPTGAFSPNDVGATITGTGIAGSTTILTVPSSNTATISNAATATGAAVAATITTAAAAALTDIDTALDSPTLTGAAAQFTAADVGRHVSGTGIPANTYITSVAVGGATATMSNTATALGTDIDDVAIRPGVAVPSGAYVIHVVSNGGIGANLTDLEYMQSIVSSGSTFTVADY